MNEVPKCLNERCCVDMIEIGGVGKDIHYSDMEGKNFGAREVKLYQCPICKDIKLI